MTQLELLNPSAPREQAAMGTPPSRGGRPYVGVPAEVRTTPTAAGSRRRSVEDLRSGPRVVYAKLGHSPAKVRAIAKAAGIIRSATLAHLRVLEAAGLAVSVDHGRWRRA